MAVGDGRSREGAWIEIPCLTVRTITRARSLP